MAKETEALYKANLEAEQKMKELDKLSAYPPFRQVDDGEDTLDYNPDEPVWSFPRSTKRGAELTEAMQDAVRELNIELKNAGGYDNLEPSILAKMWDGVMSEFEEDLDEARLFEKRYPDDSVEALIAAFKMK